MNLPKLAFNFDQAGTSAPLFACITLARAGIGKRTAAFTDLRASLQRGSCIVIHVLIFKWKTVYYNRLYSTWLGFTIKKNLQSSLDIKSHIKPDISILFFPFSPLLHGPWFPFYFAASGHWVPFPKSCSISPLLQPGVAVIGWKGCRALTFEDAVS